MHSNNINGTNFHYNSDMSGSVIIQTGEGELEVSGSDLMEFVLDRLRDEKISRLEDMSTEELKALFI